MSVAVRFTDDRGPRRKGDVVRYDDASAAHIVGEGVAEYVGDAQDRLSRNPHAVSAIRAGREHETDAVIVSTSDEVEHTPTGAEAPQTASAESGD